MLGHFLVAFPQIERSNLMFTLTFFCSEHIFTSFLYYNVDLFHFYPPHFRRMRGDVSTPASQSVHMGGQGAVQGIHCMKPSCIVWAERALCSAPPHCIEPHCMGTPLHCTGPKSLTAWGPSMYPHYYGTPSPSPFPLNSWPQGR